MMRSMAQEFARKGNPMLTERERAELQARLIPTRGGRKMAKPKAKFVDVIPPKSTRVAGPATEALKEAIRLMECPARRYQADPTPAPRPLVFAPRPDLEAIAENKARSVAIAKLKSAQDKRDAEAEIERVFRGFELNMVWAMSE